MKKVLSTLSCLIFFCGLSLQANEISTSFTKETKVIFKVNLDKLRKAKSLKRLIETDKIQNIKENLNMYTGMNFDDVSRLWVGLIKDEEVVIILQGGFDVEYIKKTIDSHGVFETINRDGVELAVNIPDDNSGKVNLAAVINENTIAFGNPKHTKAFLDAYLDGKVTMNKNKMHFAAQLNNSNNLFHGTLLKHDFDGPQNPLKKNLKNAQLKIDYNDKMEISLKANLLNPKLLKPMKSMLEGFIGMASNIKTPKVPDFLKQDALDNAKVSIDGDALVISASLTNETVETIVEHKTYRD